MNQPPIYAIRHTQYEIRNYAKRTQSTKSYVPEGTKTNPISLPTLRPSTQKPQFHPQLLSTFTSKISKIFQKNTKKRALFHLFYPPKAAFLHFLADFSIPFASFINCFMQNKPNFTPNAPTKHANDANFIPIFHYLSTIIYPPKAAFPQKCPKKHALFHLFYPHKAAFCRFLQLLDINTLNSMYNKDLHNFFNPKYPCIMRLVSCVFSPLLFKTNPIFSTHPPIYPSAHSLFYAKQTQFTKTYVPEGNFIT